MSVIRLNPEAAARLAAAITEAATNCQPNEHVRIERVQSESIGVGVSNGWTVRAERLVAAGDNLRQA